MQIMYGLHMEIMIKYIYEEKKKLVFLAFATIAIALLLEAGILKYVNDSNTYRMSKVLLDRVITVLNKNDDSENGLIESLKDDI